MDWVSWCLWCLLAFVIYGYRPLLRWKYRHIPGPPPTFLVGNLLTLIRNGFPEAIQAWAAQYGPVFKIFQGGNILIVVADPVAARKVNIRNNARANMLSLFAGKEAEFDRAGILIAEGPMWSSLRQAWQRFFQPQSLCTYTDLMNDSAVRFTNIVAQYAKSGEVLEIWRLFGRLTMSVVGSAAFGVELHTLDERSPMISPDPAAVSIEGSEDEGVVIQKAAAILFGFQGMRSSAYTAGSLLFPFASTAIRTLAVLWPDQAIGRLLKARHSVRSICYHLINQKRAEIASRSKAEQQPATNGHGSDSTAASASPAKAAARKGVLPVGSFVELLLQADNKAIGGRPFTDLEIASQINSFLLAGYETTSNALGFVAYHVARNPEVQAKLLAEIDEFGRDRVPTYEDTAQLPYLDAVVNEALRMSPPAGLGTIRKAREDFEVCGFRIPKDTPLNTAMYTFQNSSEYWTDACTFKPERFMSSDAAKAPAFAPFGDGGRNCIGVRFAKAEAKIALIRLYQKFTLQLLPGQEPLETRTAITTSPKNGILVTATARP